MNTCDTRSLKGTWAFNRAKRKALAWLETLRAHAAAHSKDPHTQVAAAILRPDWSTVALGYNGMPKGTPDTTVMWDRPGKYDRVVHAERNAFRFAREGLDGYIMVCTHYPCEKCAADIANAGIAYLYHAGQPRQDQKCDIAADILQRANVCVVSLEDNACKQEAMALSS